MHGLPFTENSIILMGLFICFLAAIFIMFAAFLIRTFLKYFKPEKYKVIKVYQVKSVFLAVGNITHTVIYGDGAKTFGPISIHESWKLSKIPEVGDTIFVVE